MAATLDGLRARAGDRLRCRSARKFVPRRAGITHRRPPRRHFDGRCAFGAFILSAVLTLAIVWPFESRFILSPRVMLQGLDDHAGEQNEPREFYRALALQLEWRYDQNARKIRLLQWGFQLAIVFLVLEVAAWIVVLWRG